MDQFGSRKSPFWSDALETSAMDTSSSGFNPSEFLIPGWKGDGLISPAAITIKTSLSNLTIDAQALFKKSCATSKSMKLQTYNEFLKYAEVLKLDLSLISHQNDFWLHAQDESSPLKKHLDHFIKLYAFRAVSIYLFRIKFILDLAKELNISIAEDNLFNPLSFLGKIFKKDSSTELVCESLQINEYSWYRPTLEYKESLLKIKTAFESVTLTEIIKIISTPKDDQLSSKYDYSHSISHRSFGLLINELLIKMPVWLKPESKSKNLSQQKVCILPSTINTKFCGNHIAAMALSHWLAQDSNVKISQWNNLICPEFEGSEFFDGQFLKICQELQFLSFLTRVAIEHKYEIVPFICKIMKDKYRTSPEDLAEQQVSLFNIESGIAETLYSRIVLNLSDLPKSNPHHYVVNQLLGRKNQLKKDGVIVLLTNQKLFVPSHSERVELLLKDFKIEASFNLEELKGKGEIANFIYILSKRPVNQVNNKHLFEVKTVLKESCLSFEMKGNLSQFNKFLKLVEEFQTFTRTKNAITTPLYASEIDHEINFEFHQDAIIEGKLISSVSTKDNGHIPHPRFFNNLMKSCTSLETFFNIEMLAPEELYSVKSNLANELLGLKTSPEKKYPLLLIINQSDALNVKIELTSSDSFRAKVEKYGTATFQYFGLTPKSLSLNLNVFREYFNSSIGNQIIQLHLNDGPTKLKAKLKSLLIPIFFANTHFMPHEANKLFAVLELEESKLRKLHPMELLEEFGKAKSAFARYADLYPWHILGLLANFKIHLTSNFDEFDNPKLNSSIFSNPLIANELVRLKTQSVYPSNSEVFIDYKIKTHQELQLPLQSFVVKADEELSILSLKYQDRDVIQFHTTDIMNQFIKFILQRAVGAKISDILMNLKVPSIADLEKVTTHFSEIKNAKENVLRETEELISTVLRNQISR